MAGEYTDEQRELQRKFMEACTANDDAPRPPRQGVPLHGFYFDMDADTYHSDPCDVPCLSASLATILLSESPEHAYLAHPSLGARKHQSTKEMERGDIVHQLLLGKGRGIEVLQFNDYRKKAAQEARDAAKKAGRTPMLDRQYREIEAGISRMRAAMAKRRVVLDGQSEVCAFWKETADDGTIVHCRAMFDHLTANRELIWDLKVIERATRQKIENRLASFGEDIQAHAYVRAVETIVPELAGRVRFKWAFVEFGDPFATRVAYPSGSMRQLGELRWRQAVNLFARCLHSGNWPSYPDEELAIEAKPWLFQRAIEHELEEGEAA
jgi:hypothetical protein